MSSGYLIATKHHAESSPLVPVKNKSKISRINNKCYVSFSGGILPEKLSRGVRVASQSPYAI